jgi:hypothetical protein
MIIRFQWDMARGLPLPTQYTYKERQPKAKKQFGLPAAINCFAY